MEGKLPSSPELLPPRFAGYLVKAKGLKSAQSWYMLIQQASRCLQEHNGPSPYLPAHSTEGPNSLIQDLSQIHFELANAIEVKRRDTDRQRRVHIFRAVIDEDAFGGRGTQGL